MKNKYALLIFGLLLLSYQTNAQELLFNEGFESGILSIGTSGTPPEVVISQDARGGNYVLKSQLSNSSIDPERSEVSINENAYNFAIDQEYWVGISSKLDEDFNQGDFKDDGMIMQWHYRDWKYPDDDYKPQPFLLRYKKINGEKKIVFQHEYVDKSDGNKNKTIDLDDVPAHIGVWDDWVINIRFSETNGKFKVWRNGELVLNWVGNNHLTERPDGAYLKWGLYSFQYDDISFPNNPNYTRIPVGYSRTVYHDEVRMAGADGNFDLVSPGNYEKELLLNGDFNDEKTHWEQKILSGNSTFSVINEDGNMVAEYDVTQAPVNVYELKLRQRNVTIPENVESLTFRAKAATEGGRVRAILLGSSSKPSAYFDLTTEWTVYELSCSAIAGEVGYDVEFQFPETGIFYFDDIAFRNQVTLSTNSERESINKTKLWFGSDNKQLFFKGINPKLIEMYSIGGIKVNSYKKPTSPLNFSNISNGVYIMIIHSDSGYEKIKIVK